MSYRAGFTLIEMLLVVAVIALLIAMLLPALETGRELTRRTRCAAQMHSMGVGAVAYAMENLQYLPPGRRDDGFEHCVWVATVTHDVLAGRPRSQPTDHVLWERPAMQVLCPNMPASFGYFRPGTGWVIGYNYLGRHPDDSVQGGWISPRRASENPSLLLATDLNNWSPPDGWSFIAHTRRGGVVIGSPLTPQALNSEGGNLLELGGAVQWQPLDRMTYRRSGYGDAYPCYW